MQIAGDRCCKQARVLKNSVIGMSFRLRWSRLLSCFFSHQLGGSFHSGGCQRAEEPHLLRFFSAADRKTAHEQTLISADAGDESPKLIQEKGTAMRIHGETWAEARTATLNSRTFFCGRGIGVHCGPVRMEKISRNHDVFRTVSCRDVVESTQIHARSDTGASDLHWGCTNDTWSELEPQPGGNAGGGA